MTLKTTLRTLVSLTAIAGLAMSGPAFAGTCDAFDLTQDHTVNQADGMAMAEAILAYNSGDLDYNEDGRINILDIVSSQADAKADVEDFGFDVVSCVTGGFDLNGDGKTNVIDVVLADAADKSVIGQCVLGNGDLDYNGDGVINVLDATGYSVERNARAAGFALAVQAEILDDISRLDHNHDGEINVRDAVIQARANRVCK